MSLLIILQDTVEICGVVVVLAITTGIVFGVGCIIWATVRGI